MSEQPEVAGRVPLVIELEEGKNYAWCHCGKSGNQPFCDGSHAGTDYSPLKLELTEAKRVALCRCKRTGNQPFCDGSHASLE